MSLRPVISIALAKWFVPTPLIPSPKAKIKIKSMKKQQRNELIQVRVSADEKATIMANSDGNLSGWLRQFGLNNIKQKSIQIKQDPLLINEVKFIGNNLNQIAKVINTIKKSDGDINLISVQSYLISIDEKLNKLIKTQ